MTIKEVEQKTGLQRSNVRFYEKEELIQPKRNEKNGYRMYSDNDIENIKKIAYLRTLGISIEDIRRILKNEISLYDVIEMQSKVLNGQIEELSYAKKQCEVMLKSEEISFEKMNVEEYIPDLEDEWERNGQVFQIDSVGFFYLWGGTAIWGILTIICFVIAVFLFSELPAEIPVQWSKGVVTTLVDKKMIFAYPTVCIVIRFLLRPLIWRWLQIRGYYSDAIADYLSNYLCFVAVSVEVFTLFYIYGITTNIVFLLLADTVIFMGMLGIAWNKLLYSKNGKWNT